MTRRRKKRQPYKPVDPVNFWLLPPQHPAAANYIPAEIPAPAAPGPYPTVTITSCSEIANRSKVPVERVMEAILNLGIDCDVVGERLLKISRAELDRLSVALKTPDIAPLQAPDHSQHDVEDLGEEEFL